MGRNSRKIKNRAIEFEEEYDEAKAEQFRTEIKDEMEGMDVYEMDIDFFQGFIDSFSFPDRSDWAMDKACGEADDYADAKYEQMKEERMGL